MWMQTASDGAARSVTKTMTQDVNEYFFIFFFFSLAVSCNLRFCCSVVNPLRMHLIFSVGLPLCVRRLLVERVFAQYMVPHNLETAERMKCLYYLYATLDTNAVK